MKAVLQRVKNASVTVNDGLYSEINGGLLIFLGIEKGDDEEKLDWMVKKVLALRIFEDDDNKMNKSLMDINGDILVVSQFTLAADCKKGTRPSFDSAEIPAVAEDMYEKFIKKLKSEVKESKLNIKTGVFGAMMEVKLCNDGPVTIILEK